MGRAANGVRVEEFLMVLRNDMLRMVSGCEWTIQPWRLLVCAVSLCCCKKGTIRWNDSYVLHTMYEGRTIMEPPGTFDLN